MNNAEYWARRFKIMEDSIQDQAYDYAVNLEEQYNRAIAQIDTQMRAWYQRFADNNGISWADAQKMLTSDELKEFKWTVEEYIKYGKEHAISGAWAKELENASARVHISRLDSLKLQLQQQAEALTGARIQATTDAAKLSYTESYYHTAFEVQRGIGVGWTMQAINRGEIEKLLSRPWTVDNQTFRARCWTDKTKLVETVNQELTRMIATGEAPDKAIEAISKRFNVSKQNAGRVVMTESAYFATAAQKDCFEDLGVEKYTIVAALDGHTCDTCGDLDSQVFKMSDYQVGATAPPFHPWCRCCTAPYFEDMEGLGDRYARDAETGERYKVPKNTTYKDWKAQQDAAHEAGKVDKQKKTAYNKQKKEEKPSDNSNEYKSLSLDEFKKSAGSISQEERNVLYGHDARIAYINSSEAKFINEDLRNDIELTGRRKVIADTLSEVIDRNTINENIRVYRYVDEEAFKAITGVDPPAVSMKKTASEYFAELDALPAQIKIGNVYTEKGFLSTSAVEGKNVFQRRRVCVNIKVPKGTSGYITTNVKESEIIFNRGTKLRVDGCRIVNSGTSDHRIVLDCSIVGE